LVVVVVGKVEMEEVVVKTCRGVVPVCAESNVALGSTKHTIKTS